MTADVLEDTISKLAAYEDTGLTPEEVKKLAVDRYLYKRAFEEVCRQFNFGDEKDYEDMRDAFLRIVGEGYDGRGNYERD